MEAVGQYDPGRRSLVGQFGSRRACAGFRFRCPRPTSPVQHLVCTGTLFFLLRDAARPPLKDIVASLRRDPERGILPRSPRRFPSPLSTHFGIIALRAWLAAARVCGAARVRAAAYFLLRHAVLLRFAFSALLLSTACSRARLSCALYSFVPLHVELSLLLFTAFCLSLSPARCFVLFLACRAALSRGLFASSPSLSSDASLPPPASVAARLRAFFLPLRPFPLPARGARREELNDL